MAESRQSGTPSSSHLIPQDKACSILAQLLESDPLKSVVNALRDDATLHLVGGVVRDIFLSVRDYDFDLTTSLPPTEVLERLKAHGIHALDVGMRHGTVIAAIDGHNVEITTFRKILQNGSVGTGTILSEDLRGRDFTINAVAFSVREKKLIDPFNGLSDMAAGIVRGVQDPVARFKEDPLRLLRMVRFGPAQGRKIEPATEQAARSLFSLLPSVSVERIRVELDSILLSNFPGAALRCLKDLGALEFTLPELIPTIGVEQNEFHTENVFDHTISVIERSPRESILRWTALCHDLGKPPTKSTGDDGRIHFYGHEKISADLTRQITERLKFSHADAETILLLVREHMRPLNCGEAGTRRILRDLNVEYPRWRDFKIADAPPAVAEETFTAQLDRFDRMVEAERGRVKGSVYSNLAVDGNDIIKIGVAPGPRIGALLKRAQEAVIDNPELNDRETLLAFVKKMVTEEKL